MIAHRYLKPENLALALALASCGKPVVESSTEDDDGGATSSSTGIDWGSTSSSSSTDSTEDDDGLSLDTWPLDQQGGGWTQDDTESSTDTGGPEDPVETTDSTTEGF